MENSPLWVFGYGSLMWNPGFDYEERVLATLPGYARTFCMWSIHHRGTPEKPGLVLALDPHEDEECHGLGFSVRPALKLQVLDYLRERELISSAYVEKFLPLKLADGREVEAVVYVVDTDHVQYTGALELERQAQVIAGATGGRGPNTEYLYNTQAHLDELGIEDADLRWLAQRVRSLSDSGM
ncbi:gamma-glutamylcyclotransferase [Psychromarinibacter sp. C21-152]|uniref:glutathione-specific gamma-glutamylcyclotransferase n=1 Tax=Psychromarinibacter sediminicola TaxID=3033385 RepID=A0AAE3NVH2_9RHOB|nr:gamma-glutamylcyclotransferase [Psychromarinibacter sediminicola]MDF0603019.1 gamma-glutamylcyclotransferase [Psychromarinibacter sediminicola]